MKPNLLFVSPRFLFPADEGGKIRTSNILRQMKGGPFHITLASPAPPDTSPFHADLEAISDSFLPWPATPSSRARRIAALLDRRPLSVATDDSPAGRAVVAQALAQHPAVAVIDFPHAAVLTPGAIPVPSVLFTHNVEAEIYERHARLARGLMRPIWNDQARKMQRFEGDTLRRFDRVIAVSTRDAKALRQRFQLPTVDTIDTGVDLVFFTPTPLPPQPAADAGTIVFTGVMDSPANTEGIRFLMDQVWPRILQARPQAQALIVGRNPPPALVAAAPPSMTFTGTVDDIRPHVARADLAVIPLNVGSGTRIKAFEAMAMGRPVLSTTIGVEGLAVTPDEHLLIADDAPAFAAAILRLLAEEPLRHRLVGAARNLLETHFSLGPGRPPIRSHLRARHATDIVRNLAPSAQTASYTQCPTSLIPTSPSSAQAPSASSPPLNAACSS